MCFVIYYACHACFLFSPRGVISCFLRCFICFKEAEDLKLQNKAKTLDEARAVFIDLPLHTDCFKTLCFKMCPNWRCSYHQEILESVAAWCARSVHCLTWEISHSLSRYWKLCCLLLLHLLRFQKTSWIWAQVDGHCVRLRQRMCLISYPAHLRWSCLFWIRPSGLQEGLPSPQTDLLPPKEKLLQRKL